VLGVLVSRPFLLLFWLSQLSFFWEVRLTVGHAAAPNQRHSIMHGDPSRSPPCLSATSLGNARVFASAPSHPSGPGRATDPKTLLKEVQSKLKLKKKPKR
jgi:hypothetical protein